MVGGRVERLKETSDGGGTIPALALTSKRESVRRQASVSFGRERIRRNAQLLGRNTFGKRAAIASFLVCCVAV